MRTNIALFVFLFICSMTFGQINQTIVFDTTIYHFSPPPRWAYVGTFEFQSLPQPLKTTRVNFELEAVREDINQVEVSNWQIRLLNHDNVARVIGDTLFNWPGPHKRGDRYSGSFEFIPLMAGRWTMVLANNCIGKVPVPDMMLNRGISFQWCIDENGELQYLNQLDMGPSCSVSRAVFITPDTLHFPQFSDRRGLELCDYDMIITPIPHIDDTSTIIFNLHANSHITPQYDIAIGTNSTDISFESKNINFNIPAGDNLVIPVKFVPRLARERCSINLVFNDRSLNSERKYQRQSIACGFIFDDDGKLRYCGGNNFGHVSKEKYPRLPYQDWHPKFDPKDTTVILHRYE
ncbi:MAG: hypothetical protein CVT49_02025 [candidate division Zixibacteria bacterium HGW-Zixibacteria-1]|nr:MAG: hypothetical protein CVT49_02025 [candidate division Zixibacteria bacterium HGW-Zixibacteria-1]